MNEPSPLIILGMHRAGTSVLTRLLREAGLFTGRALDRNDEAAFPVQCNRWLLRQAGATWHTPEPMRHLLNEPEARRLAVDYLGSLIDGPHAIRFLGPRRWGRYRSLHRITEPWGWKDPCNIFTLPIWLDLFPQAKVVHIRRHGIDVARSLKRRRERAMQHAADRYQRRKWAYRLNPNPPKASGFAHAPRCATIEGGLDLWATYLREAAANLAALGDRALDVRYEDLLHRPEDVLDEVSKFSGLSIDGQTVARLTRSLNVDRAFAYQHDPTLKRAASRAAASLEAHGYPVTADGRPEPAND